MGRYCHICGQENIEPKESAWHLITHFFEDITHFDGKFFSSVKLLIKKPGLLSREYMIGRRASYLNPVRMYVFASAIFFLIFFSLFHFDLNHEMKLSGDINGTPIAKIKAMDSATYRKFVDGLVKNDSTWTFAYDKQQLFEHLDSTVTKAAVNGIQVNTGKSEYKTVAELDSAVAHGKKMGWFEHAMTRNAIQLTQKYHGDNKAILSALLNALMHSLPQLLFVTLPLFALLLKLLYFRHKQYYYVNHAIFTIHFFVFVFILLLCVFGVNKLEGATQWSWLGYLNILLVLGIFFYNYKAMRFFYQQGRFKTILKFLLLHTVNICIIMVLFVAFTLLSLFKI
ncbi:MAG: DUF3667 domain-containing protein [Bacteroidetes bacterium]|nr:DUF3667 domain-containing protein [Bacteroidota bacterium]